MNTGNLLLGENKPDAFLGKTPLWLEKSSSMPQRAISWCLPTHSNPLLLGIPTVHCLPNLQAFDHGPFAMLPFASSADTLLPQMNYEGIT